jgi:hypothetical protein
MQDLADALSRIPVSGGKTFPQRGLAPRPLALPRFVKLVTSPL